MRSVESVGLLSAPLRYGLAVVAVGAAALVAGPLGHLVTPDPQERLVDGVALLYAAVVFSAWLAGTGPGLLAAALAVLAIDYFIVTPQQVSPSLPYLPRLAVFALSGGLVGWLRARSWHVEEALRRSRDELDVRVQDRTADLTSTNQQLRTEVAARMRVEEALREQAELLDLTHDSIIVRDTTGVIGFWNRGAEERYGWAKEEAVGRVSHELLQTVFPLPLKDLMVEVTRAGRWEGELVHTRRDGTRVVVASRWSLKRDEHGRPTTILEINNDITGSKRAEESLRQAQVELAHVTRVTALGELAASIAHEINQPLAAIVADANACLHWLAIDRPDLESVRVALRAVAEDGNRAAEVIERIRALLSRSSVARQPCDVADVIRHVLPLVRPELERYGITLDIPPSPDLPQVMGDQIQLQQVVLNLIMNAAEASREVPPERRRLRVGAALEHRADGPWAVVAVEDAGIGFSEQEPARLFEAFYTTKPNGLGMGLAISRSIIEVEVDRLNVSLFCECRRLRAFGRDDPLVPTFGYRGATIAGRRL
jgi:two-component system sensor kinase FixL